MTKLKKKIPLDVTVLNLKSFNLNKYLLKQVSQQNYFNSKHVYSPSYNEYNDDDDWMRDRSTLEDAS